MGYYCYPASIKMFKTFEALRKYIYTTADFNASLIKGKKARITKREYNNFLNVLPPLNWINEYPNSSFYLEECLSHNLYYKFMRVLEGKKLNYYCIIAELEHINI